MKFIDTAKIKVSSGSGGSGCISFRKEARVPKGGPDGGDGGKGGDIIFRTNAQMRSLLDFRYKSKYKAEDGSPGKKRLCFGAGGKDLIIEIPPGTLIKDLKGRVLFDCDDEKKECLFLRGGRGGKGNAFFKSSTNQSPQKAQKGEKGSSKGIILELKLLADVGIIGLPNAGKSTLISRLSDAKPKIADYPFTTLVPQLGVVSYQKGRSLVVADLPGLIEGAHLGKGLGIQFLRHIERTRFLVHLVDVMGGRVRVKNLKEKAYEIEWKKQEINQKINSNLNKKNQGKSNQEVDQKTVEKKLKRTKKFEEAIWENYKLIQKELRDYDKLFSNSFDVKKLRKKKQIVVFNKSDLISETKLKSLQSYFKRKKLNTFSISAATGKNLKGLIYQMGKFIFN